VTRAAVVAAVAVVATALVAQPAVARDGDRHGATITDERVTESSGLVQSTRDPSLGYTVNDSGNAPVVFSVDLSTGEVVGTATLRDVELADVEALALGADDRLYVGDIGDNAGARRRVHLYALRQPGRGDVTVDWQRFPVRYADGPRDAEALVSDRVDGSFYLVSKGLFGGDLYRLGRLRPRAVTVARPVPDVSMPGLVTDADVVPGRRAVVLRTYSDAVVLAVDGWEELDAFELPAQRQGETLAVIDGGPSLYVGSEGSPSPLEHVRVPREAWRELGRRAAERRAEARRDDAVAPAEQPAVGEEPVRWPWWVGGGAAALLVAGWLVSRRRADHEA
jgi:hypothetical protein